MRLQNLFICLLFSSVLSAQYDHVSVFPDLEGDELKESVLQDFKASSVLNFSNTRDTMFGVIYEQNDSVTCVYSGYTKYLDPTQDPTTFLYENGGPNAMNTEHVYPQSKGAEFEPAKSDLHHLFPTRGLVNSARGSFRFAEIPDNQTNKWYKGTTIVTNIPGTDIDDYSEVDDDRFEPREDFKGNVARAMFYFFTMYEDRALNEDPSYFESQKEVLCDWHFIDPVDKEEWDRTHLIAQYQEGKVNPFVLDCSVASRLYCPESDPACDLVPTQEIQEMDLDQVLINPNPSNGDFEMELNIDNAYSATIGIYDMSGKVIYYRKAELVRGKNVIEIYKKIPPGMYISKVLLESAFDRKTFKNKIIIE